MSIRLTGSTSGYTEIDAPAVAGSNTLVLPTGNGSSGQVMQTNGSGTLTFAETASSSAPATASSTGRAGQVAYDSSYIYVCVASNSWKRAAISAW